MDFSPPLGSTPVSHSALCHAVAPCGRSPTLTKLSFSPFLTRTREGTKPYSKLLPPIRIVSTPVAIGPIGPATVWGTGGGYSGPSWPFSENAHTASPLALLCSWLPPVAITTNCSPSTSYTTGGASAPNPVWNRHSSLPLFASMARKLPSGSPRKTRPPAVTLEPPPPPRRYGVLCCHAIVLVLPSMAVNVPLICVPIGAACVPPT